MIIAFHIQMSFMNENNCELLEYTKVSKSSISRYFHDDNQSQTKFGFLTSIFLFELSHYEET
jgi:hypothetical protein